MTRSEMIIRAGVWENLPDPLTRAVPQKTAHTCELTAEPRHVSIWDYAVSPKGEHFFSVCAEGTTSDYARLYEYLPESNTVRRCFRLEDVSIVRDEAVRPSKIHSSLAFLPDGRVIMASHTTAAAPTHPRWMPFAYYPDLWEGYPGSNILIYDPKTGKTEDMGVPVLHESIYGGTYEESTDSFYFSGYHRGHMYRFDLKTRRVTDFGQATEFGTWRYIHAPDGNLYTTTATGRLVRLNIARQAVEDIPFDFPIKPELLATGTNNKLMHFALSGNGFYFTALSCQQLMYFDCASSEVKLCGSFVPPILDAVTPKVRCMGMCADECGVLWYLLEAMGLGLYLVSQDAVNGGAPVLHGLIGSETRAFGASFGCFVRDGVLFASDTNRGNEQPAVMQVTLAELRENNPGPVIRDPKFWLRVKGGAERYQALTGRALEEDAAASIDGMIRGYENRHSDAYVTTLPRYYREHPDVPFNGDTASNVTMLPNRSRWVCKLWKQYGTLDFAAVGFTDAGEVWAQTTDGRRIFMKDGAVTGVATAEALPENDTLAAVQSLYLPYQAERRHLCVPTAACHMSGGRILAGTADGMLAMVRGEKVFSIGSIGLAYPVHDLAVYPGGTRVLGVAGGKHDLGMVFTYDDEEGLILHGRIFFQDYHSQGVLGASSEPYKAAISADGKFAAIAVKDRLSCVYRFELESFIVD